MAALVDDHDDPSLRRHALGMRRALDRLVDGLAVHGGEPEQTADDRAVDRFARAREAAGQVRGGPTDPEALRVLARWEAVLDAYAQLHGYPMATGRD